MVFRTAAITAILCIPSFAIPADLPIFDAHLHYSHDAWENLPPADAVAILKKAGIKRALISSSGDEGQQRLYAAAREGHTAEELLAVIDQELEKVIAEPVAEHEMQRAAARFELGLLGGLETADGKASTIGFYEAVLGRPAAAFERLEATLRLSQSDLLRAARRYLDPRQRSVIIVRPELGKPASEAAE